MTDEVEPVDAESAIVKALEAAFEAGWNAGWRTGIEASAAAGMNTVLQASLSKAVWDAIKSLAEKGPGELPWPASNVR